jgi:hypothetical protein
VVKEEQIVWLSLRSIFQTLTNTLLRKEEEERNDAGKEEERKQCINERS